METVVTNPQYQEERMHLYLVFKATQKLSGEVQSLLSQFVVKYNSYQNEIAPGITYSTYMQKLSDEHKVNLSDHFGELILGEKMPLQTIEAMTKSVQQQMNALEQMKTQFSMLL